MISRTDIIEEQYKCPLCGNTYEEWSDASECLRECYMSGMPFEVEEVSESEKGFKCDCCGEKFSTEELARSHAKFCFLEDSASVKSQVGLEEYT